MAQIWQPTRRQQNSEKSDILVKLNKPGVHNAVRLGIIVENGQKYRFLAKKPLN